MTALPLGMRLVPKPLGPQMMSTSLELVCVRQKLSKVPHTPELFVPFCGMMLDMKKTASLSARVSVRSSDGQRWPRFMNTALSPL